MPNRESETSISTGQPRAGKPYMPALLLPVLLGLYLILTSTLELVPGATVYDGKRLIQPFLFLTVLLTTLMLRPLRHAFAEQAGRAPLWAWLALGAALALGVISALRFPHPGYSLAEPAMFALMILSALAVAASRRVAGKAFDRFAMAAIALLGLAVAVQELMGLLAFWSMQAEYSFGGMLVHFAHPRFYNQLQTWTVPLLAALSFACGGTRKLAVTAILLLGLQWAIVLISGGRGSFVAILTALVTLSLLVPAMRRVCLKIHLPGFLLGGLLYAAILAGHELNAPRGGEFLEQSVGRPMLHTTGRTAMWRLAWQEAMSDPWLGVGPARYQCENQAMTLAHPHNLPLQLAAEWGIPATVTLLVVAAWVALRLLRQLRRCGYDPGGNAVLCALLYAGILAAALHANLSGLLMTPASQVMVVLLCGWLLGALRKTGKQPPGGKPLAAWLLAAGLAFGTMLSSFTVQEFAQLEQRLVAMPRDQPAGPRYWQNGHICRYSY